MSYLIGFLERAGQANSGAMAVDGELSRLPAEVRAALLTGDPDAVATLCGFRTRLVGYVSAPDREPPPEDVPDELPTEPDQQEPEAA